MTRSFHCVGAVADLTATAFAVSSSEAGMSVLLAVVTAAHVHTSK